MGLLAAGVMSGCASGAASPQPGSPAQSPTTLQVPAAPTNLKEWTVAFADESGEAAHFSWTPPPGKVNGYYFWTEGNYVDIEGNAVTPPPAICGPTWEVIPASATTYEMESVQSAPEAYICAFNDAGTSPTVQFPPPSS
jgi:hypothetical protein